MAEEPTGGFLRSLPGVVTALAGLITAVGGLVGALVAAGVMGPSTKPHTTAPAGTAANSPVERPAPRTPRLQRLRILRGGVLLGISIRLFHPQRPKILRWSARLRTPCLQRLRILRW